MDARIGRQTPTTSVVLPYERTLGQDALELYNQSSRTARQWQELLIYDIMAINDDGLWTHSKFGYSLPRRNGKTEDMLIRMAYGASILGEKILFTAHRTSTSHNVWEKMCALLDELDIQYKSVKAQGQENIRILDEDGSEYPEGKGHRINFRTRTNTGGLGEGYDVLIIDEAQEYTIDQDSTLKYVVTSSMNPQTIYLGTPPTAVSAGTVFVDYRNRVLHGETENNAWCEWGIDKMTDDIKNKDLWYEVNPSLGCGLTERTISDETTGDKIDFNIQRLGVWLTYNQKSEISEAEWDDLAVKDKQLNFTSKIFVGIKYGVDNKNVCLSIALKTDDERIFIECIDCREIRVGSLWIVQFLKEIDTDLIVIDGKNGQDKLKKDLKDYGIRAKVLLPTVSQFIEANSSFRTAVSTGQIVHNNQPSLRQVATNCEKRLIGSHGGFGFKSQNQEMEIGLLESAILAYWACSEAKERKKQKVYY